MFGLPVLDLLVIAAYFVVVIAIGVWCSRRIKSQEDYFLGGRAFGKLIQTFASFGQGTSADNAIGVTTTTFSNGASGMWASLLYLFATPVYWVVTPWMRRLRLLTTGDFFLERYGSRTMAAVYALIGSVSMMAYIAVGFAAMTTTIVAMTPISARQLTPAQHVQYEEAYQNHLRLNELTPETANLLTFNEWVDRDDLGSRPAEELAEHEQARRHYLAEKRPARTFSHIDPTVLIWVVCLVVAVYAVSGGLEAAFLTDTLQGFFIILLSVMLIPFAWSRINESFGGDSWMDALRTIHARLPSSFFEIFGSPNAVDFTWYYILAISVMTAFNVVVQPNVLVATGSARDEYTARYGFTVGNFIKRVCTIMWGMFGLAAVVLYAGKVHHSDLVWGYATVDLLGPLQWGLVGLMIACLMAALMSSADCFMLTSSSLLTHNLYRMAAPGRSERHYVWIGRLFGAAVLVGSVLMATAFDTILQLLKFIWEWNVLVAPAFWVGMKWRRANRLGAWASILVAALAFFIIPGALVLAMPQLRTNEYLLKTTEPAPLTRTYLASAGDVAARRARTEQWDRLAPEERSEIARPEPLEVGQQFTQEYRQPRKSVFWTMGVRMARQPDGVSVPAGAGQLNLELVALDWLGFDLGRNSYAVNETVRILIRMVVPFLVLFAFTFLGVPDDRVMLDRFFVKMRTKVCRDRDEDAREMALSLAHLDRHRDRLLFPGSQWEFLKWQREDWGGFLLSVLAAAAILAVMGWLVGLGG
ncbi:MAG: sodium:solute symporter family protein [Patescibacteria group bacterium]|nr:sodium:solute symporter family protein [Patescibacteria group bacterium]